MPCSRIRATPARATGNSVHESGRIGKRDPPSNGGRGGVFSEVMVVADGQKIDSPVIPGWSEGPDPESKDSPMCNCTSEVRTLHAPE
jgi:hypothetical protein